MGLLLASASLQIEAASAEKRAPSPDFGGAEIRLLPKFETNAKAFGRDAGITVGGFASAPSGMLWLFGDTFIDGKHACDPARRVGQRVAPRSV